MQTCNIVGLQLNYISFFSFLPASEDSTRSVGADARYVIKVVSGLNNHITLTITILFIMRCDSDITFALSDVYT